LLAICKAADNTQKNPKYTEKEEKENTKTHKHISNEHKIGYANVYFLA